MKATITNIGRKIPSGRLKVTKKELIINSHRHIVYDSQWNILKRYPFGPTDPKKGGPTLAFLRSNHGNSAYGKKQNPAPITVIKRGDILIPREWILAENKKHSLLVETQDNRWFTIFCSDLTQFTEII